MSNYLRYYKDIVIPKLKAEVKDMEQSLNSGMYNESHVCTVKESMCSF